VARCNRSVLFVLALFAFPASSQTMLDLPRTSQQAEVKQRIGLTWITVDYSRPLVNGRDVWKLIEPVWRAGANENTTFEVSDQVLVEGKPLPAGTYGLFMIAGKDRAHDPWTVIFSRNSTSWGQFTYDEKEDALRVTVSPKPSDFHEALAYDVDDVKPDSAVVTLRWEKLAIPFKVSVDVDKLVAESARRQVRAWSRWNWQGWDEAAGWLVAHKGDLAEALEDSNQSINVEERADNTFTKADVLQAMGKTEDAAAARAHALNDLGDALQLNAIGRQLQFEGKQDRAFEVFRANIKRFPKHWITHVEAARLASAAGKFDDAVKEMKLAGTTAPPQRQAAVASMLKKLEAKQDINK
jgi:tetratricopeptide (TPR) repeat protein